MFTPGGRIERVQVLRWLLRDAAMVLVIAAATEMMIHAFAPQYRYHRTDEQFTGGYPVERNEDGSRGLLVRREKAAGTIRVLCLGDSTTFGTGVPARAAFPAQLMKELGKALGQNVEVINAGAPGYGVKDLELWLVEHWAEYDLDQIVLAVSANCVSWAWVRRDEPARMPNFDGGDRQTSSAAPSGVVADAKRIVRSIKGGLALPYFLRCGAERAFYKIGVLNHLVQPELPLGVFLGYGWRQANLPPEVSVFALEAFDREMESFLSTTRQLDIPVVVTVMPPSFTISEYAWDNEKSVPKDRLSVDFAERTRIYCEERGVPFADLADALREARREQPTVPLYIPMDYSHLSPLGHQVAARAIARSILR